MAVDPAGNVNPNRAFITNPVFMSAFLPGESITFPYTGTAGAEYKVVDYYGNTVVSRRALPASPFTVPALPLGWYKIYLYRAVFISIPWGDSAGSKTFCVVRSTSPLISRPSNPNIAASNLSNDFNNHIPARGYFGLGPSRHTIQDLNSTSQVTGLATDITYEFNQRFDDSLRVQQQFVAFPNGYAGQSANLTSYVQSACNATGAGSAIWFEAQNEPNIGSDATTFAAQENAFADVVHAAHAKGRVLGPCVLSIYGDANSAAGTGLAWFRGFFDAMGANLSKLDGLSFHNYDNPGGNLDANRKVFDKWVAMLTTYGQHNKPRWNTEFGSSWAVAAGVFMPRQQARLTLLELMLHEQYLIPKERTSMFYDLSHGFWDFPSFWIMGENQDYNVTPLAPLMKVYAEELWGKAYSAKLDFGSENSMLIGSRFTGLDGASVVAVQNAYGNVHNVVFTVTGTSSVTKSDAWGNLTTIPVVGGTITVQIDELITYLRAPNGATITPAGLDYGVNVTRTIVPTFTNTTSNPSAASKAASGDMTGTPVGDWTAGDIYRNDWVSAANPQVIWQEDFSRTAFVNRVVVTCPFPANGICTFIDFDIEGKGAVTPGVWTVIASFVEDVSKQEIHTSTNDVGGCYVDTYFRFRNQWSARFDPAMALDGIRLVVKKTTFGQRPTPETWNRQYLTMIGGPTGGTFTLTWNGVTTAPIAFNAPPSSILAALQATTGGSTWKSTITGSTLALGVTLVADRIWPLTANSSGLTGGSSPTVVVSRPSGTAVGGDMFLSGPPIPQLRQVQVYLNEYDFGKTSNSPLLPAI